MTAINSRISGLKPLVFGRRSALGLVVVCTIALSLALIAMATSQHSSAFAESPPASQPDTLQVGADVQDVATDRGSEDPSPAMRESSDTDQAPAFESHKLAVWLTTMAVGLSSDSSVTYLAYISSLSHARDTSTIASSANLK